MDFSRGRGTPLFFSATCIFFISIDLRKEERSIKQEKNSDGKEHNALKDTEGTV